MKHPAVFLDRDGVLIEDKNLITNFEQVKVDPFAFDLIRYVKEQNFFLFLISNQSVVSRGLLSFEEAQSLNEQILNSITYPKKYIEFFNGVYLCPFHIHAQIQKYKTDSDLRKPKPGMILAAASKFEIDLSQSFMVGDRISDVVAGNLAGCKSILIDRGPYSYQMIETNLIIDERHKIPNYTVQSLEEIMVILGKSK
jgi:D-glycero-D-manno-heptose 1,7-bisphosphate phosphatase